MAGNKQKTGLIQGEFQGLINIIDSIFIYIYISMYMYICIYDICSILLNGHDSGTEKMEVPIVYKAVVSSLCRGIPHKIWAYIVQYLLLRILIFSLIYKLI